MCLRKLIHNVSVTYVLLLTPERMRAVMLHNSVLSVPAKISSNIRLSSAITPWIGSTFSSTLRVFCVELRAALRSEDEPPVAHDSNDSAGDDDGLAASFSAGAELAKAADKMPDKVDLGDPAA